MLPVYIKTVILPFRRQICYDGFLQGYRLSFGGGYKRSLNEAYKDSKAQYGIITDLPFDGKTIYDKMPPKKRLEYFMKTKANREEFGGKIDVLLSLNPELDVDYWQIWNKIDQKYFKKRFKDLKLNKAYYAMFKGNIISGAATKKEVEANAKAIVPAEFHDYILVFRM